MGPAARSPLQRTDSVLVRLEAAQHLLREIPYHSDDFSCHCCFCCLREFDPFAPPRFDLDRDLIGADGVILDLRSVRFILVCQGLLKGGSGPFVLRV